MPNLLAIWWFLCAPFVLNAQSQNTKGTTSKTITGKATDLTGVPLEGAVVVLTGTDIGVSTTIDGSFTITAKAGDVLEISLVGYRSRQIVLGKENSIIVSLTQTIINLDEVLLTGYTSQKVKEITGVS